MRRAKLALLGGLMVAGLFVGPRPGTVAAATARDTGFICYPHGTTAGGPSTIRSAVKIDFTTPGNSILTCQFPNINVGISSLLPGPGSEFGGACTFDGPTSTVAFSHRIYAVFGNTAGLVCWGGVITPKTDLSITKTDGVTTAVIGASTTYTIVVTNNGPSSATGSSVADAFPATITADTWTAVGSGGASGFTASGSGTINDTVNLPVGATITYTVSANIAASATGNLVNTATVTAPAGLTDPNLANNTATDTDTLAVGRTLTTTVSNFNGRDFREFDLISYGTSQCTNQLEDGIAACVTTIAQGTVVTVDLQDESFFTFTCPGTSEQNASGTGPYTGQCIVTMDANKQVSVVGDASAP